MSCFVLGILNVHRVMPDKDWTFLHYACLAANPRIINFFLSQGASVNYVSKSNALEVTSMGVRYPHLITLQWMASHHFWLSASLQRTMILM